MRALRAKRKAQQNATNEAAVSRKSKPDADDDFEDASNEDDAHDDHEPEREAGHEASPNPTKCLEREQQVIDECVRLLSTSTGTVRARMLCCIAERLPWGSASATCRSA
jgi:hypothetical protein